MLLDEDGAAAGIVGTGTLGVGTLVKPAQVVAGVRTFMKGHRQGRTGRRPTQLGATLVLGPGDVLLYEDHEEHAGDHADLDDVIAALVG